MKCHDWLLFYQPHTKLAADFSDTTNLRLFVSPTASGSKLRKEKPAGVTVQVFVWYSTASGKKNRERYKMDGRGINKEGQEMKE